MDSVTNVMNTVHPNLPKARHSFNLLGSHRESAQATTYIHESSETRHPSSVMKSVSGFL